ncbi:MAG: diguanylate cyclase, partial [Solirubrobacteraceae bacterium]
MDGEALGAPDALYQRYIAVALAATALMLVAIPLVIVFGHLTATWTEIEAEIVAALAVLVVAALLPWRSLAHRRSGQVVLYAWSLFDVADIGAAIASSGGQRSWFWALFLLTTIFFSVGYPPAGQLLLLGVTLVTFAAASAAGQTLSVAKLLWEMAIIVATFALASFPVSEMRRQTTEQRRAREEAGRLAVRLAEREEWWRSLIERTNDPIVVFDRQWHVQFASPAYENLLGYSAADVESIDEGMTLVGMVHPDDLTQVREGARAVADGLVSSGEVTSQIACRLKTKNGDWRVVELAFAEVPGTGFVANLHDVTARVAAEAALSHQATHDSLTGLGNRSAFYDALRVCLAMAARRRGALSVLILDLESFKVINDTVGHAVGDQLLVEVSRRLSATLRAADIVARLGGDEFAAVLTTGGDPGGARAAAERVLHALDEPVVLVGRPFWLRASIGVSCYPSHGK